MMEFITGYTHNNSYIALISKRIEKHQNLQMTICTDNLFDVRLGNDKNTNFLIKNNCLAAESNRRNVNTIHT